MTIRQRKPFFERLKAGLQEGIAHARGQLSLRTVEIPEAPPEIDAATVVALRKAAAMSQAVFAKLLFVSTKTVQSWEQGVRAPSMAARRLIQVFAEAPATVCKVVGLPAVRVNGIKLQTTGRGKRRIAAASARSIRTT
jgi:putative transcriptional regulator